MFRILIVEDMKNTLKQLTILIAAALQEPDGGQGVVIHKAEAVEDARRLILSAAEGNRPYHAVILDFMLPKQVGFNPEISSPDESLCLLIRHKLRHTLVAHITAYSDDEAVSEHLRVVHQEKVNPRALFFSKAVGEYAPHLVTELSAFLYGTRIEEQIALVFGAPRELAFAAKRRAPERERGRSERSLTHDIAALRRDIVAHWHHLDERLHDLIREYFRVDDASRPVRISLRQPTAGS